MTSTPGTRTIQAFGNVGFNPALWRVLTVLVAAGALAIGLTAETHNGQTILSIALLCVFGWMGTRPVTQRR